MPVRVGRPLKLRIGALLLEVKDGAPVIWDTEDEMLAEEEEAPIDGRPEAELACDEEALAEDADAEAAEVAWALEPLVTALSEVVAPKVGSAEDML